MVRDWRRSVGVRLSTCGLKTEAQSQSERGIARERERDRGREKREKRNKEKNAIEVKGENENECREEGGSMNVRGGKGRLGEERSKMMGGMAVRERETEGKRRLLSS